MASKHQEDTLAHVSRWLTGLGSACPGGQDPVTAEKVAVNATLLVKDFPTGAFTIDSMHFVAQGQLFFPAYETIRLRLTAWWNVRKPASAPAIEDERYRGLTAFEQAMLRSWDRAIAPDALDDGKPRPSIAVTESMLRRFAPRVWDRLNPGAEPCDPRNRQEWLKKNWDDEEGIFNLAFKYRDDQTAMGMLRGLVERHAPQHIDLVPL